MKTKLFLFFVFLFIPAAGFAEEISVTVKGMVCSFCAQGVKRSFGKLSTVQKVEVDLDKKLVKLRSKESSDVKDEEITKIINDAGYDVVKIEREMK